MVAHPFPTPKIRVGEGWPVNQALLCKVLSAFLRYHSAEESLEIEKGLPVEQSLAPPQTRTSGGIH
jgi:hypothetical protein